MNRQIKKVFLSSIIALSIFSSCNQKKIEQAIELGSSRQEHIEVVLKDSLVRRGDLNKYLRNENIPCVSHWTASVYEKTYNGEELKQYSYVIPKGDTIHLYRITETPEKDYRLHKKIAY